MNAKTPKKNAENETEISQIAQMNAHPNLRNLCNVCFSSLS